MFSQVPIRNHFVCFQCRRTAKHIGDDVRCTKCHHAMADLGRQFHAPPRNNIKQWRKLRLLYQNGWRGWDWDTNPRMSLRATKEYLVQKPERERAVRHQYYVLERADEMEMTRRRNMKRRLKKKAAEQQKAIDEYQEGVLEQVRNS